MAGRSSVQTNLLSSPLDSHQYLASPLATLLKSVDDPQSEFVTLHDLAEAYTTLSRRIRLQSSTISASVRLYPALEPLKTANASLSLCLIRDVGRCLLNPFSIFSQQESASEDGSAVEEGAERAQAYATLSHHALVFLSDVFSLTAITNIFTDDQLRDLLRELLLILSSRHLPTPNSKKSWDLAIWTLTSQRLHPNILLSQRAEIKNVLNRLVQGSFEGYLHRLEGLKLFSALLQSQTSEFMDLLLPLYPITLALSTEDTLDVRMQTLKTLRCIASLKLDIPDTRWSRKIASYTHTFIKSQMTRHKSSQERSFQGILLSAIKGNEGNWKGRGPLWASLMVACLICLSDADLFTQPHSLKLFLSILGQATNHKRTYVRALHPHIWNCLVWCYSRLPDTVKDPQAGQDIVEIKERAFLVLRQELKGGIATALVASRLSKPSCTSGEIGLALDIIKDLLSSSKESQIREGVGILARLVSGVTSPYTTSPQNDVRELSEIVIRDLFVGSFLDIAEEQIRGLASRLPGADTRFIRPLTENQVRDHWRDFLQLWVHSVNCTHTSSTDYKHYEDQLLSIWQSLLLVQSQLNPKTTLLSMSPSTAEHVTSTIICFVNHTTGISNQLRQLNLIYKLWSVTKQSYGARHLVSLAEAILSAVLRQRYTLNEEEVKSAWSALCVDLVSIGVPNFLHSVLARSESQDGVEVQRQFWVMMAGNELTKVRETELEEVLSFLVIPLQSWTLDSHEVDVWTRLFSTAVVVHQAPASLEVVNVLLEKLGAQGIKSLESCPGIIPTLLTCLRFNVDDLLHLDLLHTVNVVLIRLYPPAPEDHILALPILRGVAHLVSSCDVHTIVQFIVPLKDGLCLWFKDRANSLLEQEHSTLIHDIYCASLGILSELPPSPEMLQALSSYLASSFERMGFPPIGPLAFEQFWRAAYHDQHESLKRLIPEDLRACLKAWSDHCGDSLAEGLPSDSQSTSRSLIPDSQSPDKAVFLRDDQDLSHGSDEIYHLITSISGPTAEDESQDTPTAKNPRLSTPKTTIQRSLPHSAIDTNNPSGWLDYVSLDLAGSRDRYKRSCSESAFHVPKRRRIESGIDLSKAPAVISPRYSKAKPETRSPGIARRPKALLDPSVPAVAQSHLTSTRSPQYRYKQLVVRPSPEAEDFVPGSSPPPAFASPGPDEDKRKDHVVNDHDEIINDSTEMEYPPFSIYQDYAQTSDPLKSAPKPSPKKRLQSEPALGSDFASRPTPLRRNQTTSEHLGALERAYSLVSASQGVSQVPVEELAHAARLASKIGAKITEQLSKKLRKSS